MLDQNTDRMWYVIGAVLIGAAIIFGMNTLMPEAFASVGGMFDVVLDSTSIIANQSVEERMINYGSNIIKNYDFTYGLMDWNSDTTGVDSIRLLDDNVVLLTNTHGRSDIWQRLDVVADTDQKTGLPLEGVKDDKIVVAVRARGQGDLRVYFGRTLFNGRTDGPIWSLTDDYVTYYATIDVMGNRNLIFSSESNGFAEIDWIKVVKY